MALEAFTGIWSLNASNPDGDTDPKQQGDDHIKGIKYTLRYTFPNVLGVVNASDGELNMLVGVTSAIQTQLDAKAPIANPTFTGTVTAAALSVSGAAAFTSSPTVPTASAGDSSTKAASTAFVAAAAFASALPAQSAGVANYAIVTDGSSASWAARPGNWLYLAENCT